jgi:RNA polymerase sigma-70 factor (ECF subfamily)
MIELATAPHSGLELATALLLPTPGLVTRVSLYPVHEIDDIVARCQRGDASAFRVLFTRHRVDVARLVFRMVGPRSDLEDLIQEVFLQVYKSLKDFKGQAKFSTWLHRVTVNVVLMERRAAKSRPQLAAPPLSDLEPDGRIGPDEDATRHERARAFRRIIDRLGEKKRVVFVLHEIEGLPPAEIATIVGAPVLTVRTRLFYARRELAQLLKEEPSLASFAAAFERPEEAASELPRKAVEEAR